jgi:hypothetical protein
LSVQDPVVRRELAGGDDRGEVEPHEHGDPVGAEQVVPVDVARFPPDGVGPLAPGRGVVTEAGERLDAHADRAHAVHLAVPGDVELARARGRELPVEQGDDVEVLVDDHVRRSGIAPQERALVGGCSRR